MSEKYIRDKQNNFTIVKNSKVYGKFNSFDVAVFARDLLVLKNWNLDDIDDEVFKIDGQYVVLKVIDDKLCYLGSFDQKPDSDEISMLAKRYIRNPNNSKYGLNITKLFDEYVIKKQIAGDEYVFGVFDNLDDATFSRNFLLDHMWNVDAFGEIEYFDETDTYKIVEIFGDRIYVLGTFSSEDEAQKNLENSRHEFLNRIYKHKMGLANYPRLDILTDHIHELEDEFQMKTTDDVWNLSGGDDPLNDIIFNLTPWQKIVYDAGGDEFTFDELEKSLGRYRSKNFDKKIRKNLDELVELNLIEKVDDNNYRKK